MASYHLNTFIRANTHYRPVKILFVIDAPLTYSIAPSSRLIYIAKFLKKKGLNVELIGGEGEKINDIHIVNAIGKRHTLRLIILFSIYEKAMAQRYTHIIVRGGHLAFFLLPLKILITAKIILDFHEWMYREIQLYYERNLYNKLKVMAYYLLEKIAARFSDMIICVSRGVRELLDECMKNKTIILENGLEIKEVQNVISLKKKERRKIFKRYSLREGEPLLGFMGNWERQLDMELIFNACETTAVSMIVVGEGPGIDLFREKYKENITFAGRLPRLEGLKVISVCDATVVPYKQDSTLPMGYFSQRKVKDYLGLGKPILMADVKGRERFLTPYENALFYSPGDAEDLAEKIKMLVSDEELREKMRKNNSKLARKFDWQALGEKSGLIEKLLES